MIEGIRNYRPKSSPWCPKDNNETREVPKNKTINQNSITNGRSSVIDIYIKNLLKNKDK